MGKTGVPQGETHEGSNTFSHWTILTDHLTALASQ